MELIKSINVVDSHTVGEPTRVVVGGIPTIPGKNMAEKKEYLEKKLDHIRRMLMHEPRGHNDMFGAIITPPTRKGEADLGVIFMDGGGYLNMCCHGSMGVATVLIDTGMIEAKEPYTDIVLDAPAGLIKARVNVENKKAKSVSITNVPSFLFKEDLEVEIPSLGKIKVDISFGGSFFALVDAKDLGIDLEVKNIDRLVKLSLEIRKAINNSIEIYHPEKPYIKTVDLIEIYDRPSHSKADLKNVVIFGRGQFDRSPCGTGTSAKLAALYSKGKINLNEPFVYESISGTTFTGKVLKETKVGEFNGVVPEVTGKAFITGFNQLIIDSDDPFKYGFVLPR